MQEGFRLNHKRLYRLYREEKLMVRRRVGRKRALGTRAPLLPATHINQRWGLDSIGDTLSDGRRIRILCVVDDFSRECLACVVDTSLSGVRVVRELERLTNERATPDIIVNDNGTELTSAAALQWVPGRVNWHYIEPGKPVQNALYRKFQQPPARRMPERTSVRQPGRSRAIVDSWRQDYNHARPHSSLGKLTPSEFAELQGDGPPEQAQAARPLALPPHLGHNINPELYS